MEHLHGVSVVFMNIHDLCGPASPNTGDVIHDHEVIEFKALGRHRERREMTSGKKEVIIITVHEISLSRSE